MSNWRQWGTQGTQQPAYGKRTVLWNQSSASAGNAYQTTVLSNHNQDNLKPGVNTTAINRGNTDGGGNVDLSGTVVNRDTIYLNDGAGLGNKATWGVDLLHKPTTISGYGITDAQGVLPNAPGSGYVLMRDSGGAPYWSQAPASAQFASVQDTDTTSYTLTTAYTQYGNAIGINSPVSGCMIHINWQGRVTFTAAGQVAWVQMYKSTNNGSTWSALAYESVTAGASGESLAIPFNEAIDAPAAASVVFRVEVYYSGGSTAPSLALEHFRAFMLPVGSTFLLGPALTASMQSTESGTATATYPTTSATATTTVPVTASGGTPSYTYAAAVVSGPGSLVNGTTANPEVKLTETTTDPGTAYNTVINSTVTDSASNTATTGNCTVTQTFTQQYAALSLSVSTTSGVCSTTGAGCTATGSASVSVSGGSGSYSYSWAVTSGTATLATPSASSTNVSNSETAGASESVTVQVTVSDPKVSSANASGTLSLQAIKIS